MNYSAPDIKKDAFTCPYCNAFAKQEWHLTYASERNSPSIDVSNQTIEMYFDSSNGSARVKNLSLSKCQHCKRIHIWASDRMILPSSSPAPLANEDTPAEILRDYNEARDIVSISPRGASALLRLALQKLCVELGEPGHNINDDIASLVRKGLDSRVQKALDALRVIGNECVHPGTMDLKDDHETAVALFKLFNLIVDKMISEPKHVDEVYSSLPASKLEGIMNRDKSSQSSSNPDDTQASPPA